MKQYVVSGIVDKIEPIHDNLTFISFHILSKGPVWEKRPFYGKLDTDRLSAGTAIDFVTRNHGFWF